MLSIMMLMLAQEIGPPGDEPEPPRARVTRPRSCIRRDDEIVVCGGGNESQRLMALPEPGTRPVFGPATVRLSPNTSMTARTKSSGNSQLPAPRMMIDFKLDF